MDTPSSFLTQSNASSDVFSLDAHRQMTEMLARVGAKYAEGPPSLSTADAKARMSIKSTKSERSERLRPSYISRMRMQNPMFGFMNVLCVGHPLLQYDAVVDEGFLRKYNIKMGHKYTWDRDPEFMSDFLKFVSGPPGCGGDGVKTAQAAQWVLMYPKSVGFVGAFSANSDLDDLIFYIEEMNLGHRIEPKARVKTSYQFVVRHGKRWSEIFICDSKAANLSVNYIDQLKVATALERAQLIFFSTTSGLQMGMEMRKLAYYSCCSFKTLCIQISHGTNLDQKQDIFLELVPYIDTLFVSKKEALELIKVFKIPPLNMWVPCLWNTGKSITLRLGKWIQTFSRKICTVVVYDSIKVAYVTTYEQSPSVEVFPSHFYKASNVVDLFGCECAFSGGFIAQMIQGNDIEACMDCAFFCASAMATQWGANFPLNRLERYCRWQGEKEVSEEACWQRKQWLNAC